MSTAPKPEPCPWCAGMHTGRICGLVRAIEFHENGRMKRVEFHPMGIPAAGADINLRGGITILDGPAGSHGSGRA